MRKQEIEGQLELDFMTGMVKVNPKKKTATSKGTKKTLKADISKNVCETKNSAVSGGVLSKTNTETAVLVNEIDPVEEEELLDEGMERNTVVLTEHFETKNEIVPEVMHHIEEHLAAVGSIHIGTIMRICRLSAVVATVYYETLLANGSINSKGRTTGQRTWKETTEKS